MVPFEEGANFVGVLAGDDLRLSEINMIVCGLTAAFGTDVNIELGTVNDEETFSGRLAVVTLVFEQSATAAPTSAASTRTSPPSRRTAESMSGT